MEDIFRIIVDGFPDLLGLALFGGVMFWQNTRLMNKFFEQLDDIQERLSKIEGQLSN